MEIMFIKGGRGPTLNGKFRFRFPFFWITPVALKLAYCALTCIINMFLLILFYTEPSRASFPENRKGVESGLY